MNKTMATLYNIGM